MNMQNNEHDNQYFYYEDIVLQRKDFDQSYLYLEITFRLFARNWEK